MADERTLSEYISIANKLLEKDQFDKYIRYAVFPNFKTLKPGAKIEFDFPLTAIIGPNGSGKSSILYALYGMPLRYSTSKFWFSTTLDPIQEGKKLGPNRYYYSHFIRSLPLWVETKKVRGRKNESYWEPARASVKDGMQPVPKKIESSHAAYRSKDRWNPTSRECLFISFKYQFSSFDRVFHINNTKLKLKEKISLVKKGAAKLNRVISANKMSYKPGGVEAVFLHRKINDKELFWVNRILGKKYSGARYIEHRLYGNERGPSVIFEIDGGKYSEAFAGSGELAIVNLVVQILNAEEYALVLLDEPETSLHPGAQEHLLKFLLWCIVNKKLQIVVSTHSPTIVNLLPVTSLKTLEEVGDDEVDIVSVEHPQMAFSRIGLLPDHKILLVVEDQLLAVMVNVAIDRLEHWKQEAIKIHIPSSGGDDVMKNIIPVMIKQREDIEAYFILDGDKKPSSEFYSADIESMSAAQGFSLIKKELDCEPLYVSRSNEGTIGEYVDYVRERVFFLDEVCPEIVALKLRGVKVAEGMSNERAKELLIQHLGEKKIQSDSSAQAILFNTWLRDLDEDVAAVERLKERINRIFENN